MVRVRTATTTWSTPTTTSRSCQKSGCQGSTREGKPFCSAHVEQQPYVQGLLNALQNRRAEEDRVRRRGLNAVDPDGLTSRELLLHVTQNGSRTMERLSRELQLELELVKAYVSALVRCERLTLSRTQRGTTLVSLG